MCPTDSINAVLHHVCFFHPPTQTKTKGSKMLSSVTDTVRTGLAAVATFFEKDDKSATFSSKTQGLAPFERNSTL